MASHKGPSHYGTRRLYRGALSDVPERFIRLSTAILVPCFGAIAAGTMLSAEGPDSTPRRIVASLIYLSTVPVGIAVARMPFGKLWRPYRLTRTGPWLVAFIAYADIGVSATLFTFVNYEGALVGTALFATIGIFVAAFASKWVVAAHLAFTSLVITVLALLTWWQGLHDTAAIVTRWLTLLVATNASPMILNAFAGGLQKSFDTQLESATRDPLTGLLNRRGLELWTDQALRSHPTRVDFIVVDLDHFKAINDIHGHAAGDDVLVRTATRLQATLGTDGLLGRTGGEEFAVFMTNRDSTDVARAIQAAVHDPRDAIPVTASVGVATLTLDDTSKGSRVDLLQEGPRCADIALYEAKRAGRNRVHTYTDPF